MILIKAQEMKKIIIVNYLNNMYLNNLVDDNQNEVHILKNSINNLQNKLDNKDQVIILII
jgi:hypothetical protein